VLSKKPEKKVIGYQQADRCQDEINTFLPGHQFPLTQMIAILVLSVTNDYTPEFF